MHLRYFGDSYDVVKLSLINWLRHFGDWSVHPMLTESASDSVVREFERFLGARVISTDVLTTRTNRESYFASAIQCGNLFLDPDTGLKLRTRNDSTAPKYLFASELSYLIESRPKTLTLVFDQSHPRGKEPDSVKHKLTDLRSRGVYCFAYVSHACFIVGSHDETLVRHALSQVIAESKLPKNRFDTAM
jgi:hypothetical protein